MRTFKAVDEIMKLCYSKPGSSVKTKTGEWASMKPIIIVEKCKKCGICQGFCPEGIMGKVGEVPDVDYDYCKGCALCFTECPFKAIEMKIKENR